MAVETGERSRFWPWAAVAGYLLVLVMNYLAMALPLGDRGTGEVSDNFPVAVTPAGYVFSIWGVIYLALAGFVLYQALQGSTRLDRTRILFVLTCLLNPAWLLAWHNLLVPLSMAIMIGLLLVLLLLYREVRAARRPGAAEFWLLQLPFSLYLGWISVATLATLAAMLYDLGPLRSRALDVGWAVLAVLLLTVVVLWVLRRLRDLPYALVAVWALIGIVVANAGEGLLLPILAGAAALLLLAAIVDTARRGRTQLA